jgi:hypothetical protein
MNLRRGTPVIIMDCEEPSARMVSVLTRYDYRKGIWHALYLSTYPSLKDCYTGSWTPTPIADFGVALEVDGSRFRCVPTGEASRATYRDGKIRHWQDRYGNDWRDMRPKAAAVLDPGCFRLVEPAL